jgi:hypothetical protein
MKLKNTKIESTNKTATNSRGFELSHTIYNVYSLKITMKTRSINLSPKFEKSKVLCEWRSILIVCNSQLRFNFHAGYIFHNAEIDFIQIL